MATWCGVDFTVRSWTDSDLAMREDLAAGLEAEIELRLEVEHQRKALLDAREELGRSGEG